MRLHIFTDDVENKENRKLVVSRRKTYHEEVKEETDKRRNEEIALVPLRPQEAAEECDYSVALDGESMPIPKIQFSEYYKRTRKDKYLHLKEQFNVSYQLSITILLQIFSLPLHGGNSRLL